MGERPKVYLAGPISGCNDEQRRMWRAELKAGFSDEFEFIDPVDQLMGDEDSHWKLVATDIDCIRNSDAVLANLWKESMGTAFGLAQAHIAGKFIAVADPNYLRNRMVAFYADAVERNLPLALNRIRRHFQTNALILGVVKKDGTQESFDRAKLVHSIRRACQDAKQSDLGPPRAIAMRALEQLLESTHDSPRQIPTSEIRAAVFEAIADLASDPIAEVDYDAIRRAWETHEDGRTITFSADPLKGTAVKVHEAPLEVRVTNSGNHSTIWGKGMKAVPTDVLAIFDEIRKVEGIGEIRFGEFSGKPKPSPKPHVRLAASKTPNLIEGKIYSHGVKGTMQTFRIKVLNPEDRDAILVTLREHLFAKGMVRSLADE
jgi:transcriptional regulator NrdR family protein/nucleoside 2-deoxyribosyltransferase